MTNEEIFEKNINLAHANVHKYKNIGIEKEDLTQICYIGLWKAVKTFKEEKGYKLSSYVYKVIANEIYMYLRKNKGHQYDMNFSEEIRENLTLGDVIMDEKDVITEIEEKIELQRYIKNIYARVKDEKQKKIFHMYLQGHKQQEIANTVKCSQAQVSRVLKKMKELY